jgi:hypothetical protein
MKPAKAILRTTLILSFILLSAELLLQFYVYKIARQGKLFTYNTETGWQNLPNLHLVRLNAANKEWTIRTDAAGLRTLSSLPVTNKRNLLVLGDSFAFGEGVDVQDRFDSYIKNIYPDLNIVNTGTMGFGTDQEYVMARKYFRALSNGDIVFVLLFVNDFYDVLRTSFALRSKPYFTSETGRLELNPPKIGPFEFFRDGSYLLSIVGQWAEKSPEAEWDLDKAQAIIIEILDRIAIEVPNSVSVVLAYHGWNVAPPLLLSIDVTSLCSHVEMCVDLDVVLKEKDQFFPDGHWSASGHKIVGEVLADRLRVLVK